MDAFASADEMYKNYARQAQIFDFLEDNGAPVPARCDKHPDLYVLCKEDGDTLAVALFNCFADGIDDLEIKLGASCKDAKIYRADGSLNADGRVMKIEKLTAYSWCYAVMKKT